MRFAIFAVLLLLNLPLVHAQTTFPQWVSVTQEYTYPNTKWTSSVGMVEQAIGEDPINYIVTTSEGEQLKLPKAYSKIISGDEAAKALFTERNQNQKDYGELSDDFDKVVDDAKAKIAEYDTALKAAQAKVTEYEQGLLMLAAAMKAQQQNQGGNNMAEAQQALQLMQQLQGMSGQRGGGTISKSDRARMEKDIWAAGLAKLYSARQMSDADLQALWLQARQILETRAAGQNRR